MVRQPSLHQDGASGRARPDEPCCTHEQCEGLLTRPVAGRRELLVEVDKRNRVCRRHPVQHRLGTDEERWLPRLWSRLPATRRCSGASVGSAWTGVGDICIWRCTADHLGDGTAGQALHLLRDTLDADPGAAEPRRSAELAHRGSDITAVGVRELLLLQPQGTAARARTRQLTARSAVRETRTAGAVQHAHHGVVAAQQLGESFAAPLPRRWVVLAPVRNL